MGVKRLQGPVAVDSEARCQLPRIVAPKEDEQSAPSRRPSRTLSPETQPLSLHYIPDKGCLGGADVAPVIPPRPAPLNSSAHMHVSSPTRSERPYATSTTLSALFICPASQFGSLERTSRTQRSLPVGPCSHVTPRPMPLVEGHDGNECYACGGGVLCPWEVVKASTPDQEQWNRICCTAASRASVGDVDMGDQAVGHASSIAGIQVEACCKLGSTGDLLANVGATRTHLEERDPRVKIGLHMHEEVGLDRSNWSGLVTPQTGTSG
jgi:hypothetical protein